MDYAYIHVHVRTFSSSNLFLCASKMSSLAEGRPGMICRASIVFSGLSLEGDRSFSAESFSEAAFITGLRGGGGGGGLSVTIEDRRRKDYLKSGTAAKLYTHLACAVLAFLMLSISARWVLRAGRRSSGTCRRFECVCLSTPTSCNICTTHYDLTPIKAHCVFPIRAHQQATLFSAHLCQLEEALHSFLPREELAIELDGFPALRLLHLKELLQKVDDNIVVHCVELDQIL